MVPRLDPAERNTFQCSPEASCRTFFILPSLHRPRSREIIIAAAAVPAPVHSGLLAAPLLLGRWSASGLGCLLNSGLLALFWLHLALLFSCMPGLGLLFFCMPGLGRSALCFTKLAFSLACRHRYKVGEFFPQRRWRRARWLLRYCGNGLWLGPCALWLHPWRRRVQWWPRC